jgi:hypothetical protein
VGVADGRENALDPLPKLVEFQAGERAVEVPLVELVDLLRRLSEVAAQSRPGSRQRIYIAVVIISLCERRQ